MNPVLDETHDSKVQSWVESANIADSDFPIQNLPFGVFRRRDAGAEAGVGIAIGDRIVDVAGMRSEGLFAEKSGLVCGEECSARGECLRIRFAKFTDGTRRWSAARFAPASPRYFASGRARLRSAGRFAPSCRAV